MSLVPREVGKYFFLCKTDLFALGRGLFCNGAGFSFTVCRGVSTVDSGSRYIALVAQENNREGLKV